MTSGIRPCPACEGLGQIDSPEWDPCSFQREPERERCPICRGSKHVDVGAVVFELDRSWHLVASTALTEATLEDIIEGGARFDDESLFLVLEFCTSDDKRCGCGLVHDRDSWNRLPLVGYMSDDVESLELRNCHGCDSTLAIVVPQVAA